MVLCVELGAAVGIALAVYWVYGRWARRRWWVTVLVLSGWTSCFYIIFLIVNDVAVSVRCPHCLAETALRVIWGLLYWGTLVMTFVVYPLAQDYVRSGHFSAIDRLTDSVRRNMMQYMLMGVIILVLGVLYCVVAGVDWMRFPSVASAAANAYGLILFVLLLGHGVVNVPRRLYRRGGLRMQLARAHFELAEFTDRGADASTRLQEVVGEVQKVNELVMEGDPFRPYVQQIIDQCPVDLMYPGERALPLPVDSLFVRKQTFEVSYENLVRLNEGLRAALHDNQLYEHKRQQAKDQARRLAGTVNMRPEDAVTAWQVIRFYYLRYVQSVGMYALCLACAGMSTLVVASEVTFAVDGVDLSLLSLIARSLPGWLPFMLFQVLLALPLVYIAYCAYSSLFQLRLFSYYHLVTGQKSDWASLIFSASYLCRLITPMGYNYMLMLHAEDTAFLSVMGTLDLSSFGKHFQDLLPLLILPSAAATIFKLYARAANALCGRRFQFDEKSMSDIQVQRGALLARCVQQPEIKYEEEDEEEEAEEHPAGNEGDGPVEQYHGTMDDVIEVLVSGDNKMDIFV